MCLRSRVFLTKQRPPPLPPLHLSRSFPHSRAQDQKPKFVIKKDQKGRKWRQVQLTGLESNQNADYEEVERPDFMNFSQFCECLGHIAITAFTHETAEERLLALWKWFDQSDGHMEIGKHKSSSGIRFAVRSGYE